MPTGIYHRSPKMLAKAKANLEKGHLPDARRKAMKSIQEAWTEEKRKEVSLKNRKRMHDPDVRSRHLKALKNAREVHGVNFKGGNGQKPVKTVKLLAQVLIPLGFTRELPILTRPYKKRILRMTGHPTKLSIPGAYKVDFGNEATKTAIEVDGPCHRPHAKKKKDEKKTKVLTRMGWTVIRVKHK